MDPGDALLAIALDLRRDYEWREPYGVQSDEDRAAIDQFGTPLEVRRHGDCHRCDFSQTGNAMKSPFVLFPLLLMAAGQVALPSWPLPGERLFPENVVIDNDGTAFVGSMGGGILQVATSDGRARQWISPGAFATASIFGLTIDRPRDLLWVCSNDFSAAGLAIAGAHPGAALMGLDLRSGIGRVFAALPGKAPICNDIAIADNGTVLVTDTANSRILRWILGSDELAIWLDDPLLHAENGQGGLDGIAFHTDGRLYVNNVSDGALYRIEVKPGTRAGKVVRMTTSRPLVAPDGMRSDGRNGLIIVEGAGRIVRAALLGDTAEIENLVEGLDEPSGVDLHGAGFWYVEGRLSYLFDPAKQGIRPAPFRLAYAPLGTAPGK